MLCFKFLLIFTYRYLGNIVVGSSDKVVSIEYYVMSNYVIDER